jgi:hypothetical protein
MEPSDEGTALAAPDKKKNALRNSGFQIYDFGTHLEKQSVMTN